MTVTIEAELPELRDSYQILKPSRPTFDGYPLMKDKAQKIVKCVWTNSYGEKYGSIKYDGPAEVMNFAHQVFGTITMKMLAVYADGNEHHYREICNKLFPDKGYGHDIDCWRSLENRGLIAFSSTHARGLKFYKITDLGREVLRAVDANRPYFRVVHWFKMKGKDITVEMMKADLNGEESWKDTLPETVINMLEQLFNPASDMHKLGSCYRWMNNVVWLVKHNQEFFEKIVHPDVTDWLDSHKHYYGVEKFYKILDRVAEQ